MKTDHAIRFFGSRRKMAEALGITTQAIYQWGDEIPRLRSYEILEMQANINRQKSDDE